MARAMCPVGGLVLGVFCLVQASAQQAAPAAAAQDQTGQTNAGQAKVVQDKADAEKDKKTEDPSASAGQDDTPAYTLDFKEPDKKVAGLVASPFIVLPIRCASDGTAFFNMLDPPGAGSKAYTPLRQTVHSVSSQGSHAFSIQSISDLDDVRFIAMDADDSKVAILVEARRKSAENIQSSSLPPGGTVKKKSYIALFDRNGSYTKSLDVSVAYGPSDLALLSSGEFAVYGYDSVNAAVRVSLLDSSGDLVRSIPLSDEFLDNSALKDAETGTPHERVQALTKSGIGAWRFARARGMVVLYQPGSNAPALEIGAGGARREVPIARPPGYSLDAFVPASDRWIVRYKRTGLPELGETRYNTNDLELFEVNPSDGTLRYRIDLGKDSGVGILSIACEADGEFLSYRMDEDNKLALLNAAAPR